MHFLAIFLHRYVVVVIPKLHVKIILIDQDEFLREWCEYAWIFGWIYCDRSAKTAILLFVGFLKYKNSRASFKLIFEHSLPKGFSWQNMKKSVISVLKINSRYLQSSGLKAAIHLAVSCSELYFVHWCALKQTGKHSLESNVMRLFYEMCWRFIPNINLCQQLFWDWEFLK